MEQLIMRWKNDGKEKVYPKFPKGVSVKNWSEVENPLDKWLDIVQYGLTDGKKDEAYYKECNYHYENYKIEDCYFFIIGGEEVATITVICDEEKGEGYVHMVAAKPTARGKGIGNLMSEFAVFILKKENMSTAYLTTDDWRIPAIKSYLHGGFYADESTDDFADRWTKIREILK